ncbi:hypothetical protein BBJ28_00013913 [Nothophytophthora sp. Chile5]|nr:hypothetical protein BBJ28_00013913 [Nothophytophthora sp. Chile5]
MTIERVRDGGIDGQVERPSTSAGRTARSSLSKSSHREKPSGGEPECDSSSRIPCGKKKLRGKSKRGQTGDGTRQLTSLLRTESDKLCEQLLIASEKGKQRAVYLLLYQGVDKNRCKGLVRLCVRMLYILNVYMLWRFLTLWTQRGYSPVHHAAARGHLDVLQLLLDFGWSVDVRNDSLETPLHLACFEGFTRGAEFLLDRGADINAQTSEQETPLFYAARKRHHRIVRLLVHRECDLAVKNRYGDVAEEEALDEKTQAEFVAGNEDFQRLGASTEGSCQRRVLHEIGEHVMSQRLRLRVLSFLDLKSLGFASQVSFRWHRAADSPSLWKRLGVSRWELLLNAAMGIGAVPQMAMMNMTGSVFRSSLSKNSPHRPSSCDNGGTSRSMVLGVARKGPLYPEQQRPQTASIAGV